MSATRRRHRRRMTADARVVVGIDGSETSRIALRWALAEARLRSARLAVVHGWHTPSIFIPPGYRPELVEMGRMPDAVVEFIDKELDAVGADAETGVEIERRPIQHFAARALIEASADADLVVVGRHGSGGFPHEPMTPKVVQVAHHSECPVAVVPEDWSRQGRGVVVGVDGSEHSLHALEWAAEEARSRRTKLTVVMAWGLLDQHHIDPTAEFDPHYDAEEAQTTLDAFVGGAVLGDVAVTARAINDLPARALLDVAVDAELLVVGARGQGGFRDLLLGSVSHRCLAHSPCPTVVVRWPHARN